MASTSTSTSPIIVDPKLHLPASTDPPSDSNPPVQKVWLIYGATGHVGRSLVKAVLAHGDLVTAVGRTTENSPEQMQNWHVRCQGLLCDVRIRETIEAVMHKTIAHWGRVDIIVNCAGYGVIGACEDQDDSDLRSQFDTNFMGTLNIIQLSLAYFRERSSQRESEDDPAGRYIIFSSTSGALGVPGLGPYCATKYAVEGLIESMLYEVDVFGIKATLVEPGHMRLEDRADDLTNDQTTKPNNQDDGSNINTNDNRGENLSQEEPSGDTIGPGDGQVKLHKYGHFLIKKPSAPYDTPTSPARHAERVVRWLVDRQPTSAAKSAELVWQLGHCRYPPLRLLLGSYAVESIRDRIKSIIEEIEDWKGGDPDRAVSSEKDKSGTHEVEGTTHDEEHDAENDEAMVDADVTIVDD